MNFHLELNSTFSPVWTDSCNTNTPPHPSKPTQLATLLLGWSKSGRTLGKMGEGVSNDILVQLLRLPRKGKAEPNTYAAVWLLISWISLSVFFVAFARMGRIPKCSVFNTLQTHICIQFFFFKSNGDISCLKQVYFHEGRLDKGFDKP